MSLPLLVVDAANVVGSVPDGWWRDRRGATERLRDALAELSVLGLPGHAPPLEIVLVVEGAARGIASSPQVCVAEASGAGDDTVVEIVRALGASRPCLVATADRALIARVQALGAATVGPRSVRPERGGSCEAHCARGAVKEADAGARRTGMVRR